MNLYFRNCNGVKRFVKGGVTEDSAIKEIYQAVHDINPYYKIYYTRHWTEGNEHWYDVGSHTEFFILQED